MPRIRVPHPLAKVVVRRQFPNCLTHLRTAAEVADAWVLMAELLANGLSLD